MCRTITICILLAGILPLMALAEEAPLKSLSLNQLEQRRLDIDTELGQLASYSLRSGFGTVGFRSVAHPDPNYAEWAQVQLEGETAIDQIVLVPTIWRDTKTGFQADGFPLGFKLIAGTGDNTNGTVLAAFTEQDTLLPRIAPLTVPFPATTASWVRVEASVLSPRAWDGRYILELAELMVFSGPENVALAHPIQTSSDSGFGRPPRALQSLVDGFVPYLMDAAQGAQSVAFSSAPGVGDRPTITIDLGASLPLNRIHLHSLDLSDTVPQTSDPDLGFPRHLIVEGANRPDFSDAVLLVEYHMNTIFDTGPIVMRRFPETACRYVRLTATEPYIGTQGNQTGSQIGFAEIELFSKGRNVAFGKPLQPSFEPDPHRQPISAMTDGRNLYGNVLPIRDWMEQLSRRHDLETERPHVEAELMLRYARQKANLRRMGWLATLFAAGIAFSILIERFIHLRQLTRIKERFAADLHDELGANLHTIGLLSDLAEEATDDPDELSDFLQRIRSVTERSGTAVRHVADMQNSNELFGRLKEDMQRAAERIVAQLEHDITVEGETALNRLKPRTRVDLFLFYKECLINICRHSGASRLSTRLTADHRNIVLIIIDNGRGIESSIKNGIPLSLQRRAKFLGAKVTVETPAAGGTCITLRFRPRKFGFRK